MSLTESNDGVEEMLVEEDGIVCRDTDIQNQQRDGERLEKIQQPVVEKLPSCLHRVVEGDRERTNIIFELRPGVKTWDVLIASMRQDGG